MNICILGDGLTALALSKSLINKKLNVSMYYEKDENIKDFSTRTIGISKDNLKSHDKFRAKFNVKFDLLADEDIVVLKKYKVWGKKKFMGREFMGIIRSTFLIDKKGKILKIWDNVKVKDHAHEVLKTLTEISK